MGYQRPAKTYVLKWAEGHELHGLEVTVTGLSVERMLALTGLAAALTGGGDVAAKLSEADKLFRSFARCLISWNLEDENGLPVPAAYEGIAAQDLPFVTALVTTWIDAVAGLDNPLPRPSLNGGTTATEPGMEASLPMGALSPSPGN